MRFDAPSLSPLRLARIVRWIGLWLIVAAQMLVWGGDAVRVRRIVKMMRRGVGAYIVVKAIALMPRIGTLSRERRGRSPTGALRALLGAHVRKRLRGADLREDIIVLWRALCAPEMLACALARRLRRGLTRRARNFARAPQALTIPNLEIGRAVSIVDTS